MYFSSTEGSATTSAGKEEIESKEAPACHVCEQPGHGQHFGVFSCRACAAFFRRAIVLNRKYSCRLGTGNCVISKDARLLCRYCRYKKCLNLGMTPDNVQLNRDPLTSTLSKNYKKTKAPHCENLQPSTSSANLEGDSKDTFVISEAVKSCISSTPFLPVIDSAQSNPKFTIDLTNVSNAIRNIFTNWIPDIDLPMKLSAMQRSMLGLKHMRKDQNKAPELLKTFNFLNTGSDWTKQFIGAAEFMQHSEEFVGLDLDEKVTIFRTSWPLFRRLERIATTLDIFGEDAITGMKFVIFDDYVVDNETKMETNDISDIDGSNFRDWLQPSVITVRNQVTKPMFEMKITEFEVTYMLNQLIWHVEGRGVSDATQRVADAFRDRISDELHDYYIHEMKIPRYADRLIKIMELVSCIEKLQYERGQMLNLINLFSNCRIDVRESDVFEVPFK